ncbi:MAG: spondin domain-containing protein [Rhodothermales bacterium]
MKLLNATWFALLIVPTLLLTGCDESEGPIRINPGPIAFTVEIADVQDETQGAPFPVFKSGAFNTPVGASEASPIAPGAAYEFSFAIGPNTTPGSGARLSLATMFIQSNDLFYAFPPEGLTLFGDNGDPVSGDVTGQVFLYDAGTEVNEAPGEGANQAPRQSGADTGTDEGGTIQRIQDGAQDAGGFTYPNVADVIQVTLTNDGTTGFTVRIENVSDGTVVGGQPIPLSPGAWAVHSTGITFYAVGAEASEGIEAIAEDGNPAPYAEALGEITGITVPLSPGAYVLHSDDVQVFEEGEAASQGIEDIAEDGIPAALVAALSGADGVKTVAAFTQPDGSNSAGPIGPGGSYTFTVTAERGDRLSFATMYIQSNDYFYGFGESGLALFDGSDPTSGDVTNEVALYDAGTEVDEEPGVGLNQIIRSAPDVGPAEDGVIVRVARGNDGGDNDDYSYPAPDEIIRVTITPQQ